MLQFCSIVFVKPRGRRAKGEGKVIQLGRVVADFIKVSQDETLTVISPLADRTSLNKRSIYILANHISTTHQSIPLLDIIDRIDTGIKVPHDDEDLNPGQQVFCKELVNCLLHFLNIRATAGAPHKVSCPELTGISQCFSNVPLPASRKIIGITDVAMVPQVTDSPL